MSAPFHRSPFEYKPSEQDHLFWVVVDPAKWLMPILFAVLIIALIVHTYAINLPGRGFAKPVAAPVAVTAPAAAPAPAPAPAPAG
jgi:light-harvesting protein B-800-850 alpha chain